MKRVLSFSIVLILVLMAFDVSISTAASVEPVLVSGNPSCEDLGFDFGFKPQPEPAPSGTYSIDGDPTNSITITGDSTYFSWTSTLGIDAVIVKGGPNSNVYYYSPESTGDTGLSSPDNNGEPFDRSHEEFCYDYEVEVSKTAYSDFTRTWLWNIEKDVTPSSWDLLVGDEGTSRYTVSVTNSYVDSDWYVWGEITIYNPSPYEAQITNVTDVFGTTGVNAVVDCGTAFPINLAAYNSMTCTYGAYAADGSSFTNYATVTTNGTVKGGNASAFVSFDTPTTEYNASINIDDTNGGTWLFTDEGSVSYDVTFNCRYGSDSYPNTATIRETGQSASTNVDVICHHLDVDKDVNTEFTRRYSWDILKSADQTELTPSLGQQILVNYDVLVTSTYADEQWHAWGNIRVENNTPLTAYMLNVYDVLSPDVEADVTCEVEFPYILRPGMGFDCVYEADLPNAESRMNVAMAFKQDYGYDHLGNSTVLQQKTGFPGHVYMEFDNTPDYEIDKCVDVYDTHVGYLGAACYDTAPVTYSYSLYVGPYMTCGYYTVDNTATYVAVDTGTSGSSIVSIPVDIPCLDGCSLTPGYWKTHSLLGPAPYDDTWALIGEFAPFFLSGQTYYEVLWTNPKGGNAYYILAHAYIAVELNGLNEADVSAVQEEFDEATALFQMYTPEEIGALKGKKGADLRDQFISLAEILDDYNNGLIGPGHCSE